MQGPRYGRLQGARAECAASTSAPQPSPVIGARQSSTKATGCDSPTRRMSGAIGPVSLPECDYVVWQAGSARSVAGAWMRAHYPIRCMHSDVVWIAVGLALGLGQSMRLYAAQRMPGMCMRAHAWDARAARSELGEHAWWGCSLSRSMQPAMQPARTT